MKQHLDFAQSAPLPLLSDLEIAQAHFVNGPKKDRLAAASALFGFSLGLEYHTGKKLKAILDLALECGLHSSNIIFLLGDRLQVYNLAARNLNLDPDSEEACNQADRLGDKWMCENAEILQRINLKRWREFVTDPEFLQEKNEFHAFYDADSPIGKKFKEGIDNTADNVLERFKRKGEFSDAIKAKALFVRFVLEECALFSYLAKKFHIEFIAYPSAMPSSMDVTKRYLINNDNLLKWLNIKIKTHTVSNPNISNNVYISTSNKSSSKYSNNQNQKSRNENSNMSSASTSPEVSSGSDEDAPNIAQAKKIIKRVILATANATTDGLEESGQLSKNNRDRVLYEIFQEMSKDIAYASGHSPPRFLPSPPKQENVEFKSF